MNCQMLFWFWLGRHDVEVLLGTQKGGTREIRFGQVGNLLRQFLKGIPKHKTQWQVKMSPYAEFDIPEWDIRLKENPESQMRPKECTLPAQSALSENPYPLWKHAVHPWREGSHQPQQLILFIRDDEDKFHARVLDESSVDNFPESIREAMADRSEIGKLMVRGAGVVWRGIDEKNGAFLIQEQEEDDKSWLESLRSIQGSLKQVPEKRIRVQRSRQLVETLKRGYGWRCQLCDPDQPECPPIDMGGGKFYVEVHHIQGISEARRASVDDQDSGAYTIDSADNVIVVCPYHHKLLHHYHSPIRYDADKQLFRSEDGSLELPLRLNKHL